MKTIVLLCSCVFVALAAPAEDIAAHPDAAVEHIDERDELGQYTLKYVTKEGTIVYERGWLVPTADGKDKVLVYEGEYTFIGDDGKKYTTKYKSDAIGAHQPEGDHLPKPVEAEPVPEIPAVPELPKEEIVKPSA